MSKHYDEAIGKEIKISAFLYFLLFSFLKREKKKEETFLRTCNIMLPFDKNQKKPKKLFLFFLLNGSM